MQKVYTILFIAAAVFMIYFGTKALTAPQDEKITAFNASLELKRIKGIIMKP
jgi:threonine/homoserine/homoserine lactone efflux protein